MPVPDGQGGYKDVQMPKSQYLAGIGGAQPPASAQPGGTQPSAVPGAVPAVSPSGSQSPSGANLPGKPMVDPRAEFNMKVYQPVINSDNKRIAETLQPAADTANNTLQTASLIHDLSQTVQTGWGANWIQTASQILAQLNVDPTAIKNFTGINPADADAMRKLFLQQSADAVRKLGAKRTGLGY